MRRIVEAKAEGNDGNEKGNTMRGKWGTKHVVLRRSGGRAVDDRLWRVSCDGQAVKDELWSASCEGYAVENKLWRASCEGRAVESEL